MRRRRGRSGTGTGAALVVVALVALLTVAPSGMVAASPPPGAPDGWYVDEGALAFEPLPGADAHWGVHDGAGYRIEVPADWNGRLVLHAHDDRGDGPVLTVSEPDLRQHLVAQGYAWAASSYRANGHRPEAAAADTHALVDLVAALVGPPERVYVSGRGLGGQVAALLAERRPDTVDGALALCGVLDRRELHDYHQDLYLVAETLVGEVPVVPTPEDYALVGWRSTRTRLGPRYPGQLSAAGERFKAVVEHLSGGDRPIFDEGWVGVYGGAFAFNLGAAGTGPGRSNLGIVYQFDADPALSPEEQRFNQRIVRVGPGSDPVPPPLSGDLAVPVISLHTLGDLYVPFHLQQVYARRVAAHGASDLLAVRAIRDTRHCGFSDEEEARAFDDLVRWVEEGVPAGRDEVLDPAVVAAAGYGCRFTATDAWSSSFRARLPACP